MERDLVGVFGRGRGIVPRPRPPTDDGSRPPRSRTDVRQPFIGFARRLEEEGPWVGRQGGQPDGLGRGTSAHLRAFSRVRGFEHEGPRHRGERQVERHVDEDREDERRPLAHAPILTHAPRLTASRSDTSSRSPQPLFTAPRGRRGEDRRNSVLVVVSLHVADLAEMISRMQPIARLARVEGLDTAGVPTLDLRGSSEQPGRGARDEPARQPAGWDSAEDPCGRPSEAELPHDVVLAGACNRAGLHRAYSNLGGRSRGVESGTDPDRIAPADRIIHPAVASSLRIVDERLNELLPAIEEDRVRGPPGE
jgi:hypothetical protein